MLVSVVIPAYKKELSIISDVSSIYTILKQTRFDFEIVVVVDGFLDTTFEILNAYLEENTEMKSAVSVYGYQTNKGKGYAVRYGMARSKGDYIAFIDSGMEINPNGISLLFEHMLWYDADVMVGSKRHPASKTNITPMRRLYSWGYYNGVRILFGLKVTDTQAGLKLFKREVLEKVLPRLLVKEFAFDIEVLSVANRLGFKRIFDAPVDIVLKFTEDSKWSKYRPLFLDKNIRLMLKDTLAVFYRLRLLKYYDDAKSRDWKYDEELMFRVNTGAFGVDQNFQEFIKDPNQNESKSKCRFSIIIPVRAVNIHLRQNIINILAQRYKDFEVIVITDKDEENYTKDPRIKFISAGAIGPGDKRNIGAKNAQGDILAFLDDDAYPSSNWLVNASILFDNPEIHALGGPAVTPKGVGILERSSGRVLESLLTSGSTNHIHIPKKARYVEDFPSVNLFVRKETFDEVGGFVSDFWPGEDTKFCLDLVHKIGKKIIYHPSTVVYHHRRNLFKPHLKQYSRYGQHRGQFTKIFPETSRLPIFYMPSLFVLGVLFVPFIAYFFPVLWIPYFLVFLLYLALVVFESAKAAIKDRSISEFVLVALGIISTHFIYGIYFIVGIFKKPVLKLKKLDTKTSNYIGG